MITYFRTTVSVLKDQPMQSSLPLYYHHGRERCGRFDYIDLL